MRLPAVLGLAVLLAAAGCERPDRRVPEVDDEEEQSGMVDDAESPLAGGEAMMTEAMGFGPFMGVVPSGWKSVQPSSGMRQAQFKVTPAEGDPDEAEVVAFYFGPDAGSVEANIERWRGQFATAEGQPVTEAEVKRETFEVKGMPVTMIMFKGTQKPSSMPGAPPTGEKTGWMNISAIVQTPQGPWFFKGTGPAKTMEENVDEFKQFLNDLEFKGAGA